MYRILIIIATVFFAFSGTISAQRVLSLDSCRALALKNNASLKCADNNIKSAREINKMAYTHYFPNVKVEGSAFYSTDKLVSLDLEKELGIKYEALDHGWYTGVSVEIPIYAGGQINNAYKLSELGIKVRQLEKARTEKELIVNVDKLYWQLIKLEGKLHSVLQADTLLAEIARVAKSAVDNGVRNSNDFLQVQLRQNTNKSIASKLRHGIIVARMLLAQYIGIDSEELTVDSCADILQRQNKKQPLVATTGSNDSVADDAYQTTEYALLQQKVKSAELDVKLERGKLLPKFGVGLSYSVENMLGTSHGGMLLATLSIPISDWWGGSHAVKSKELELQNARYHLIDNMQKLNIKIKSLRLDIDDAIYQMDVAAESIEQAKENVRINKSSYEAGMSLMSDLLAAQNSLQQAESSFVDAYAEYQIKVSEYQQSIR